MLHYWKWEWNMTTFAVGFIVYTLVTPYLCFSFLQVQLSAVNCRLKILNIPEVNTLSFKLCTVVSNVTKSHTIPLCPAWDVTLSFLLCAPCHMQQLVIRGVSVSRVTVVGLKCLCQ